MKPTFVLQRVAMRDAEDPAFPNIPLVLRSALGNVLVHVTARGYQHFTGRRHQRVKAMHAAYGKRKGNR